MRHLRHSRHKTQPTTQRQRRAEAEGGALRLGTLPAFRDYAEGLEGSLELSGKSWPVSNKGLATGLRRIAPNLRRAGIAVDLDLPREPGTGRARIAIRRIATVPVAGQPA